MDALLLHVLALGRHPLLVGMLEDLGEVVRIERVQHVEEILPRGALALRVLVREVRHEVCVLDEHGIQVLDAELIVSGDLYVVDLRLFEQLLLAAQDLLEKVLIDYCLIREIELKTTRGLGKEETGTYCWSKYTMKSCLLLNFQASSVAATVARDRFLDSMIGSLSILG